MKRHVLLLSLLILIGNKAFCQFNKSVTDVLSITSNDTKMVFLQKGVSNDGYEYYTYKYSNEEALAKIFYFKNDSCKFIKYVLKNEQLSNTINEFNKIHTKAGSNRWVDNTTNIEYIIFIPDKDVIFDVITKPTLYYH